MALPKIFSKEFIKKFFYGKDYNTYFDNYFSKKMKSTFVFYNIYSKKYQDVKDCFLTTEEQKKEMSDYFNNLVKNIEYNDDKALVIAQHLTSRFKYDSDQNIYAVPEYWAPPYVTFKRIFNSTDYDGDCDDLSILIVYAWGLVGIPASRRFVRAGDVNYSDGRWAGGHASPIYWSEEYNKLFPLEGTFYSNLSYGNYRNLAFENNPVYKAKTWFWTNERDSYKNDDALIIWK